MKSRKIRSFGVISKDSDNTARKTALNIAKTLHNSGFNIKLISPLTSTYPSISIDDKNLDVDCIISVGGDGTILKASRLLSKQIPILGIHKGGRGILTELKPKDLPILIDQINDNNYFIDRRKRISVSSKSNKQIKSLNEVYVERSEKLRAITYEINLDRTIIKNRMDGLIVSTPTGSTGHSMSLGSSMLSEDLPALLITPIAPISRVPPIAIPVSDFSIIAHSDTKIIIDGQVEFNVPSMEKILINTKVPDTLFIRFSDSTLRQLTSLGF
ncbi:MAG: hypothetical protein CMO19_01100 [Thaumarchaeota archaeon]|nr:hypothetical protein [Nitrososphaerota archaeon]